MTDYYLPQPSKAGWSGLPFRSTKYQAVNDADCWDADELEIDEREEGELGRLGEWNGRHAAGPRGARGSSNGNGAAGSTLTTTATGSALLSSSPRTTMAFTPKPGCPLCGVVSSARDSSTSRSPHKVLYRDDNFTAYQETANPVSSKGHIIIAFKLVALFSS